jgi:hypothetical protein
MTTPMLLYELTVYDPAISATRTLYYSDREYLTKSTDTPASTLYRNRIGAAGTLSIDLIAAWTKGFAAYGIGAITLNNPDGALDVLTQYLFDGRGINIYLGTLDATGALTRTLMFSGTMEEPDRSLQTVTLVVRSQLYKLDRPILSSTFGGTGGTNPPDGDVTIKGVTRARVYGYCFNIPLIPVDAANLIYFASDRECDVGTTQAYGQVFDSGLPLTMVNGGGGALLGEFPSLTALYAAAIPAGSYGFAFHAFGTYVKLGGLPAGQVTANALDQWYIGTGAQLVIAHWLTEAGVTSNNVLVDTSYPQASGPYPAGFNSAICGRYVNDTTTTFATVIADLAAAFCGWIWHAAAANDLGGGLFQDTWVVGNLQSDDTVGAVAAVVPEAAVMDLVRLGNPQNPGQGIPPFQITLNTCKNETVQASGLAVTVNPYTRAQLGQPYLTRTRTDLSVRTRFPLALSLNITAPGMETVFTLPVVSSAPQDTVDGFFTALQLKPHFYRITVALIPALLAYVPTPIVDSKPYRWLPAIMPSYRGAFLGVQSSRYGFTPGGKGTKCGVLSLSLDLQNKTVSYVVWTTYRPG